MDEACQDHDISFGDKDDDVSFDFDDADVIVPDKAYVKGKDAPKTHTGDNSSKDAISVEFNAY